MPTEPQSLNPWSYKPWWCQPWSIMTTGVALIAGSWWGLHSLWFTLIVAIPIGAWMGFFLLLWPRLMRESGLLEVLQAEKMRSAVPAEPKE